MPRIIYKYTAPTHFGIEVKTKMPQFAEFLSLQRQGINLVMWFQVDPGMPEEERFFVLHPTGKEFDDSNLTYLGTIQWEVPQEVLYSLKKPMVGHLFERL